MGYELFEMKAYIRSEWKILRLPEPFGTGDWQLYNLARDPGEVHDLSKEFPGRRKELIQAWQQYARDNQVHDHQGRFDRVYRQAYGT
jgi:arylsulfatase